jgi:5-dehydro-2-deoxygluconokinase
VPEPEFIALGRVNMDLYARELGAEFETVQSWEAMVGGSPANAAIAAARLGVRSALLTAVGDDHVGSWVLRALARETVDTRFVARKHGPHTSLALRAQRPPDHALAFYRHDPADIHVTEADAQRAPVERARAVLVSADALARGSMPSACAAAMRRARAGRVVVYLDLDLRTVSWPDRAAYAAAVAPVLAAADVVLGTAAEFAAAVAPHAAHDADADAIAEVAGSQVGRAGRTAFVKHGAHGATLFTGGERLALAPMPVTEASTVGAGDSFAGGLVAARLDGLDWPAAGAFASACAALTVSRFGCSAGFPRRAEVDELLGAAAA